MSLRSIILQPLSGLSSEAKIPVRQLQDAPKMSLRNNTLGCECVAGSGGERHRQVGGKWTKPSKYWKDEEPRRILGYSCLSNASDIRNSYARAQNIFLCHGICHVGKVFCRTQVPAPARTTLGSDRDAYFPNVLDPPTTICLLGMKVTAFS